MKAGGVRCSVLRWMQTAGGLSAVWLIVSTASAAEVPRRSGKASESSAQRWITPAAARSIELGLGWLASRQNDDGSFGAGPYQGNTGVVGLCGLAFLASGSTPGRGTYGRQIDRCVDYLLSRTQQGGYINAAEYAGHGPMYGHGFALLFLAEAYGMSARDDLRDKLSAAVRLIIDSQNKEGGWRYFPQRADADISVTVCQVMALRAARNAGLFVPNETIDRSIDYVKRCQNADGGFRYMLDGDGESAPARSAAALTALHSAGIYEGPELRNGVEYVMSFRPGGGRTTRDPSYYEYAHYYAAQAMWQMGDETFDRWFVAARDDVLARQRPDGSWPSGFGAEYATAMCLLVLQLPNQALPIFQR